MRLSLGKVVLTGTGSAVLMAPVLTAQAAAVPAPAQPAVRSPQNPRADLVGPTGPGSPRAWTYCWTRCSPRSPATASEGTGRSRSGPFPWCRAR